VDAGTIGLVETGLKDNMNIGLSADLEKSPGDVKARRLAFNNARPGHNEQGSRYTNMNIADFEVHFFFSKITLSP
jgi:hypothetical protein